MNTAMLMIKNIDHSDFQERIDMIKSVTIDTSVLDYLKDRLQNLLIETREDYKGNIIELMDRNLLEGWCWQTTESAIVFLEDGDFIERGNLKIGLYKKYWHSWICFNFENKSFVFDPCLQILTERYRYNNIFEASVAGTVTAKAVRDDLIYRINNTKKNIYDPKTEKSLEKISEQCHAERQKTETLIVGNDDVNSPMYRNNTGYNASIENGRIKKLVAYYYSNY